MRQDNISDHIFEPPFLTVILLFYMYNLTEIFEEKGRKENTNLWQIEPHS